MRYVLLASAAMAVATIAQPTLAAPAKPAASATLPASNPFAKPSTLPMQAPDFANIKDSDDGRELAGIDVTLRENPDAWATYALDLSA